MCLWLCVGVCALSTLLPGLYVCDESALCNINVPTIIIEFKTQHVSVYIYVGGCI